MSDKTAILDKLKEYEKTGHYDGAVGDIYALIHHIAALEEEIDDLKEAAVPRTVEGDGSDLPAGTVVIDNAGVAWQCDDGGLWTPAEFNPTTTDDHLEAAYGPYTIVYTPKEES